MPAHAPRTLAQAIERVCAIEDGGPPYAGLSDAITELGKARHRLDGLEETRALIDIREKAYERAIELDERSGPGPTNPNLRNTGRAERVLDIARFLAPAWAALEDPLGPTEGLAEAEAAQAGAEALADELRDELTAAEKTILAQRDRLEELVLRDAASEGIVASLEAELERLRRAWLTRIFAPTAPDEELAAFRGLARRLAQAQADKNYLELYEPDSFGQSSLALDLAIPITPEQRAALIAAGIKPFQP